MALLQVNNLVKYFGSVGILTGLNLEVNHGEKWGLIGKNGCGKTTLMKIMTGSEDYDQGEIHWAQNCRIGYLQQEPVFYTETIYQELRLVFKELDDLQERLNQLQKAMEKPGLAVGELETLIEEFASLSETFEEQGGFQIEGRIQGVLRGLGFPKERWGDSPCCLSGGERTRLAMARILLTANDILFLDEPTNYLDLAAIEWLEKYLADYRGAVVLISHDRYFLDQVVKGFYEMEQGKAARFRGNYTAFRQAKAEQREAALKAYLKQEKELGRLEKFVRESRATEKSKRQAQSIERRLGKVERLERPFEDRQKLKMGFETMVSSGKQVLDVEAVTKAFASKTVLNGVSFTIRSGDKIGLIGPNGVGKTTLLKIILGLEAADRGWIRQGYEVFPGYFSQLTGEDELEGTPFSQIMDTADLDNTQARTILGRFLFSGDDVFKQVADLSGGERRRLGLIKLMLSKANFLVMDEPTNHLDLQSIEVIEEALREFAGTLLVVSHDRYFLNKVANRYLALVDGTIREFTDYQAYLNWQEGNVIEKTNPDLDKPKNQSQMQRENNKEAQRQLRRKQKELAEAEAAIEQTERERNNVMEQLNDPQVHSDYQRSMELSTRLSGLDAILEELYQKWEAHQETLAQMES